MSTAVEKASMEKVLAGIQIPPQPALLLEIQEEREKASPDIKKICKVICQDVALAAAVLKTVNSPFYGLPKKIDTVQRATMLLGLSNIMNLVSSALMRNMLSGDGVSLERFWDTANDVAKISVSIANRLSCSNPDEYYTLGLFHDCGIAILAQKYPDYKDVLKDGNALAGACITLPEDEKYETNHAIVGYYMARSWSLSERMAGLILRHHDLDGMFLAGEAHADDNQMLAILKMAGHISHCHRRLSDDNEWTVIKAQVLDHLSLTASDYEDLKEDLSEILVA